MNLTDNRVVFNGKIIKLLETVIKRNPGLRFTQLLSILNLDKDRFYEEPDKTYAALTAKIKEMNL